MEDERTSSVLDTFLHHSFNLNISIVFVSGEDIQADDLPRPGALVAFSGSAIAQHLDSWNGDGDLVLATERSEPLGLYAIHVSKESPPDNRDGSIANQDDLSAIGPGDNGVGPEVVADAEAGLPDELEGFPPDIDEADLWSPAEVIDGEAEEPNADPSQEHVDDELNLDDFKDGRDGLAEPSVPETGPEASLVAAKQLDLGVTV